MKSLINFYRNTNRISYRLRGIDIKTKEDLDFTIRCKNSTCGLEFYFIDSAPGEAILCPHCLRPIVHPTGFPFWVLDEKYLETDSAQ